MVSTRTALGASLNVHAVRTLVMVSPDAFAKQLRAASLPLKEGKDYYGYILALGSSETSLLDLTNAYRTLANGVSDTPFTLNLSKASTGSARTFISQAIDPRVAFIVIDILADWLVRARTFGTDSVLDTRFWTAVKTCTSKDMRDNWALGGSQGYTVGVWVGNASGAPMWHVSGTTGAAPIWAAVMNHLHRTEPSHAPTPPTGLVQGRATFDSLEATHEEWFIKRTEQNGFTIHSGATSARILMVKDQNESKKSTFEAENALQINARITSPAFGSIIASDPDISQNRQRISFRSEGRGLRWQIDSKAFAHGAEAQWLPWPGRHVVQLVGTIGKVLDEVKIEVRSAGVKPQITATAGFSK